MIRLPDGGRVNIKIRHTGLHNWSRLSNLLLRGTQLLT
ncbi:hypothetical protein AVDCRST_MAG94-1421 [uncultured Leptolyngbya sp.]|uniref:Uncharacterized protein n=1 Tax=uncultured Leptolyngbya sp. TaxID=332963 RepID=A0A6J4L1H4_9CYAN|nr:hypothetical protein AVDCRST_MAG94-1421 [uncultured Leptolyngbya sp.]